MINPENRTGYLKNILSEENLSREHPFILAELGRGSPVVAVTAATHGDEELGVKIISDLKNRLHLRGGTVRLIVANPPALMRGVRFITEDLNRGYPGNPEVRGEAGIAARVLELVADSDFTIDLHTTSSPTESFAILGEKGKERLELGEKTGIQKIVLIEGKRAMVEFVKCGIGIELGLHNSKYAYEQGMQAAQRVLRSLDIVEKQGNQGRVDHQYYQVFGSVPRTSLFPIHIADSIKNFSPVTKGQVIAKTDSDKAAIIAEENFYSIFVGERAYKDICLKARRLSRGEMLGDKYGK